MTSRGRRHYLKPLVFALAAFTLAGCITPWADSETGRYTAPIGNSPVIANETPYSDALRCLAGYTSQHPLRMAVGQIADYTGKTESDASGRKLTQGGALMAMSALAKAGVPMVERFDTSVAELELKYANNKLIGGDKDDGDFRKIMAGSIPGSDYYIVGGITELNFNIRSLGANGDGGGTSSNGLKGTAGANMYVMNIAMDLRLVDTKTLEVVDVVSPQKQIIGRQVSAGVFDFLGHTFFDASLGESALEPIQLAVRSVIERAMLEMMSDLYHVPAGSCEASSDPLGDMQGRGPIPTSPAITAYNTPKENSNVPSNQDPYRWYGSSDPAAEPRLRGGVE
jgi:curli production assembly/transport component CsgG/holdfast attachment protein HfaB